MKIETLENSSIEALTECFNAAYADYMVPMKLSIEQMQGHVISRRVKPEFSAGVFEEGKLKGFILIGQDTSEEGIITYNAGTGVVPEARGQGLTRRLYEFLLPQMKAKGVLMNRLEVIEANERALHVYRSLGYEVKRKLLCFKGTVSENIVNPDYRVDQLTAYDWEILKSFWDWEPSWQHDCTSVERRIGHNVSLGIYANLQLAGYLIYDADTKRVQQFGIHPDHRRKGLAGTLFAVIAEKYSEEVMVINVDEGSKETAFFMEAMGLSCFIQQYEMELRLN